MSKSTTNLSIDFFDLSSKQHSGGQTGSKQVKSRDVGAKYQLKPSIKEASFIRRFKADETDRENFGEMIAATVGRALTKADQENALELVPEVSLVYDSQNKRVSVASRYFVDTVGTLDDYAKGPDGRVKTTRPHVKVSVARDRRDKDTFYISDADFEHDQILRQDLATAIAISAISGDHDVNPGNMMVVLDKDGNNRLARIDFGHAFNDLLNAPQIFGGRVRNHENEIMDFFNRETVSHLLPGKRETKLWRDYEGIVPSPELAQALKNIGSSPDMKAGLDKARQSFLELVQQMQNERDVAGARHIRDSLIAINNNISDKKISARASTLEAVEEVFNNIGEFYNARQQGMLDVAKLMEIQLKVDKMITDKKNGHKADQALIEDIKAQYSELQGAKGIGKQRGVIEWIKNHSDSRAFTGTIDAFMTKRSQDLGLDNSAIQELKQDYANPQPKPPIILHDAINAVVKIPEEVVAQTAAINVAKKLGLRAVVQEKSWTSAIKEQTQLKKAHVPKEPGVGRLK